MRHLPGGNPHRCSAPTGFEKKQQGLLREATGSCFGLDFFGVCGQSPPLIPRTRTVSAVSWNGENCPSNLLISTRGRDLGSLTVSDSRHTPTMTEFRHPLWKGALSIFYVSSRYFKNVRAVIARYTAAMAAAATESLAADLCPGLRSSCPEQV